MGIVTIVLTGAEGDPRLDRCDVTLRVPSRDTARVQEIHTATLHALCEVIEDALPRQRANRLEV